MPANRTRQTLARQWTLLRLLPSRGAGSSSRELTQALADAGHAVTKRQVERDLIELATQFPIECNDASQPWGWKWMRDADVNLPGMTHLEALSLHAVEQAMRPLMPRVLMQPLAPRFRHAADQLAALPPRRGPALSTMIRIIPPSQPLLAPNVEEAVLDAVHDALLRGMQLDLSYRSSADSIQSDTPAFKALTLHPLGLIHRGSVSYLVASAFDYIDVRLYALHRVSTATTTEVALRTPDGFELDSWLNEGRAGFGTAEAIRLHVRIGRALAMHLRETPLADNQTLQADGEEFLLNADVHDTWQLRWWLLSQGDQLTVVAPDALRGAIARTLRQALARYDAGT